MRAAAKAACVQRGVWQAARGKARGAGRNGRCVGIAGCVVVGNQQNAQCAGRMRAVVRGMCACGSGRKSMVVWQCRYGGGVACNVYIAARRVVRMRAQRVWAVRCAVPALRVRAMCRRGRREVNRQR